MSQLSLDIVPLTRATLEPLLKRVGYSNLLQTFSHAKAIQKTQYLETKLGLIKKESETIGFFLFQDGGILWTLFHVITLDRGPLWFEGETTLENSINFVNSFSNKFKKRFGRKRRWLIEQRDTALLSLLQEYKWRKHDIPTYKTLILDLTQDIEALEASYHKKWLTGLNKARQKGLTIDYDYQGKYLPALFQHYDDHKSEKGYQGPSLRYLEILFGDLILDKKLLCVAVLKGNILHSITAFSIHGNSATYQTGWTSTEGRSSHANYLALHHAAIHLKEHSIKNLDLGGINETHAEGVTRFKKRMGGTVIELIGQFG